MGGTFIFKNQSGTFFKSEAARGQLRPQKWPQDDFLDINICDKSLRGFFEFSDPKNLEKDISHGYFSKLIFSGGFGKLHITCV